MTFVNEYITPEDYEKYKLKEIDDRFRGMEAEQWTIDRERNSYLRRVHRGREETERESTWTFFWNGVLLVLRLDLLSYRKVSENSGWSHWKLVRLNGGHGLPDELKGDQDQILTDLMEALVAYKDSGVFSTNTLYEITLDLADWCGL